MLVNAVFLSQATRGERRQIGLTVFHGTAGGGRLVWKGYQLLC